MSSCPSHPPFSQDHSTCVLCISHPFALLMAFHITEFLSSSLSLWKFFTSSKPHIKVYCHPKPFLSSIRYILPRIPITYWSLHAHCLCTLTFQASGLSPYSLLDLWCWPTFLINWIHSFIICLKLDKKGYIFHGLTMRINRDNAYKLNSVWHMVSSQ